MRAERGKLCHHIGLDPAELRSILRKPPGLARRNSLVGEGEAPIGKRQRHRGHAQHDEPVAQDITRQGGQLGVRFGSRPIPDRIAQGSEPERLNQAGEIAPLRLARHDRDEDNVEHQEGDNRDIAVHHRTRHRRHGEEQRAGQDHIGQCEKEETAGVVAENIGTDRLAIDPRHHRAQPHGQGNNHEADNCGQRRSAEPSEQIGKLADLGRTDHRPESAFLVAHDDIGDERRRHEHVEQ